MSLDFRLVVTGAEGFETPVVGTQELEVDNVTKISATVTAECADFSIPANVPEDTLAAMLLVADQDVDVIFRDGAAASVGEYSLCADVPFAWWSCCGHATPVSADACSIEVDNSANAEDATIVGRIAYDNGPCPSP